VRLAVVAAAELQPLLRDAHRLGARLLQSRAEVREEDVQVLADGIVGLGVALDGLLPVLRLAQSVERILDRVQGRQGGAR